MTHFFVPGTPRPQGSKRHVGGGRMVEQSKHLPAWRQALIVAARFAHHGDPITGPVTVRAEFVFPRPKSLKDRPAPPHTSAPDTDKLQRAVGDALEQAGVIANDSQITTWFPHKRRARPGEDPGAHITVTEGEPP
ncbi:RusA family crossover junction endodeoxyribonuclease [Corynebacteriaceae bacterium 7-707]